MEFLEPIREQLDPAFCAENDIEDAYKRRNDKAFCWKALRLVTRANLAAFSKAAEREGGADIENVTRELFGFPKQAPAAAPTPVAAAVKEEVKEEATPAAEPAVAAEAVPQEEADAAAGLDAAMAEADEGGVKDEAPASEAEAAAAAAVEDEAFAEMEAAAAAEPDAGAPEEHKSRKRSADEL